MRLMTTALAFSFLAAAGAAPALAADGRPREAGEYLFSITPIVGYRMGGSFEGEDADGEDAGEEVELDDDSVIGIILNAPFQGVGSDHYTEWEFYYAKQSAGIDSAPAGVEPALELDISHFLLGGTYVGGGERARPFLSAGIGAARLSPDAPGYDSDTVFAFGIGGGAQLFPASRVGVRLEGRLLGSVIESDSTVFCATGTFGGACAFRASGDVLWQWEITAGATFRF